MIKVLKTKLEGEPIEIHYKYEPEEKEERYDKNNTGHPGSPEKKEVFKILWRGVNVYDLLVKLDEYDIIIDEIY